MTEPRRRAAASGAGARGGGAVGGSPNDRRRPLRGAAYALGGKPFLGMGREGRNRLYVWGHDPRCYVHGTAWTVPAFPGRGRARRSAAPSPERAEAAQLTSRL